MNIKRVLPLLLAVALLAACGTTPNVDVSPDGANALTNSTLTERTTGLAPNSVAFTLNGETYSMEYYLYWLSYMIDLYDYYGYSFEWTEDTGDGVDAATFFKNNTLETAKLYSLITAKMNELALSLPEETTTGLRTTLDSTKTEMGEFFPYWLNTMFVTEEGLLAVEEQMYSQDVLYDYYYGTEGIELIGDEDMRTYAEEAGFLGAKHILLMTQTEAGEQFSEEEKAAVLEQANDICAQLAAAEDPQALFDDLMNSLSEDPGLAAYPEGYMFAPNQFVAEFESATKTLADYEISEPIEVSYGYHIIMRIPLDPANADVSAEVYGKLWNEKLDAWMEQAEVTTGEAWTNLDVADFDAKRDEVLTEYDVIYQEMQPADETQTQGTTGN